MQKRIGNVVASLVLGLVFMGCQDSGETNTPTGPVVDLSKMAVSTPIADDEAQPCCHGIRGNIDYDVDDLCDISDLVYLVDYMFHGGPKPRCMWEADVDGDRLVDISDLNYLVDYMFNDGPAPVDCY
jgi:hypothetical protein